MHIVERSCNNPIGVCDGSCRALPCCDYVVGLCCVVLCCVPVVLVLVPVVYAAVAAVATKGRLICGIVV